MKILHVIPSVAPRYGGPSQAVVEMCRALRATGTEVMIATTDADGVPVANPNPMSKFLERSRESGNVAMEAPLVDDYRTDGSMNDGQAN